LRTLGGDTKDFHIDIELHQARGLSPFVFTIVLDELTKDIQDEVL